MSIKGILDPMGVNPNPLTGKKYSSVYKDWAKIWIKMPIYQNARNIINSISKHQVTLIVSGTGSGKTFLTPKYALHAFDYQRRVVITFPKQETTRFAATTAAETLDVVLGEEVGYKYRGSPEDAYDKTKSAILYSTDGTVTEMLIRDPLLKPFSVMIIDEVHERRLNIDKLMYMIKTTLKARPDFRLVLMSATIDPKLFRSYYKEFTYNEVNVSGAPNKPIISYFLKQPIDRKEYIETGINVVKSIMRKPVNPDEPNDIIFFVTSLNEGLKVCNLLQKIKSELSGNLFCIKLASGTKPEDSKIATGEVAYDTDKYDRKIVVATDVAESSITFKGVRYVIDPGYNLKDYYFPQTRVDALLKNFITQAQVKQRRGRTGRTAPGICYHLYTEEQYKDMEEYPISDILKSDITWESLKYLNMPKVQSTIALMGEFNQFIEPPKISYVVSAIKQLKEYDLITGSEINKLGEIIANIRASDINMGIALVYAYKYMVIKPMFLLMSLMQSSKSQMSKIFMSIDLLLVPTIAKYGKKSKEFFHKEKQLNNKMREIQEKFYHKSGDHMSLLRVIKLFNKLPYDEDRRRKWCDDNMLQYKTLAEADTFYVQSVGRTIAYLNSLKAIEIDDNRESEMKNAKDSTKLLYALERGFRYNVGKQVDRWKYSANNVETSISKDSFLKLKKDKLDKVFYSKLYMDDSKQTTMLIVSSL